MPFKVCLRGASIDDIACDVFNPNIYLMCAKLTQTNLSRLCQADAHWPCTLLLDFIVLSIFLQNGKDNGNADLH